MRPLRRITSFCLPALAGVLAILVFAVANLVHLPALHDALHGQEHAHSGSDHAHPADDHPKGACAIAFFAQGIATPDFDILARRPDEKPVETLRLLASAAPRFPSARRLPPGQAPPPARPFSQSF